MIWNYLIICVALTYLAFLFGIAFYAEKKAAAGNSLINNPWVYSLSIAVYCTTWTFYGSVGRAASSGLAFLTAYLGPTLIALLWWLLLRKMIRICKVNRITTIADFISSRYGKSFTLAGIVTLFTVIGILPYISLQLKAVSVSINALMAHPEIDINTPPPAVWLDTAFYASIIMAAFTIMFGTRNLDTYERHEGMVAVVAFESLVKLCAFLIVGIFIVYSMFNGIEDIFKQAGAVPRIEKLFTIEEGNYLNWGWTTVVSALAIMFLPRQFQMMVVENIDENHVKQATWMVPLYMFLITFFVLLIAFGGMLRFPYGSVNPDTFVLILPLSEHQHLLALLVFIGGLSAATSMIAVSTVAISTMVSNDLVIPILMRLRFLTQDRRTNLSRLILGIRRVTIILLLLFGYITFRFISESQTLVTIGLLSFAAAAQFGPVILCGMYWKGGTRLGALTGLCGGFTIWFYTMLLPLFAQAGWLPMSFLEQGPFGITLLKPYQLFGLDGLGWLEHGMTWSLIFNLGGFLIVSLVTEHSNNTEQLQAELYVEIFNQEAQETHWQDNYSVEDLRDLLRRFLGHDTVNKIFSHYFQTLNGTSESKHQLAGYAEKILAGAIGAASARLAVASVVQPASILTDPKRAEKTMRESEGRLRAIMENTSALISLKDTQGHFILVNRKFEKVYNLPQEKIIGKTLYDLFPKKEAENYWTNDKKALEAGKPIQLEELVCHKDGCHTYIAIKFPVFDTTGSPYAICSIATDISERKRNEVELQKSHDRLKQALEDTIAAIAKAVEARDLYVAGHQRRVALLACAIAHEMGLDDNLIEGVKMAATIHDIGKIHLPAEILSKPARLFETEFALVKGHPEVGFEILKDIKLPWPVAQVVHQHHEHLDGSGYPNHLMGDDILLESRIVCVADVVEAMACHRPYRPAMGIEKALEEIETNKGSYYDPKVVDACIRLFKEKRFNFEEKFIS